MAHSTSYSVKQNTNDHSMPVHGMTSNAVKAFARAGYTARGVVYLLVGGLTFIATAGQGGERADSKSALESLLSAPFGKLLLALIAAGLVGYSIWRFIQTFKDPDNHGTDAKGLSIRAGLGVSAVSHFLLAIFAMSLIFTLGSSSGESGTSGSEGLAGWLMSQSFGRWLVGAVGLAIFGAGIAHEIKAWKVKFDKYLEMPEEKQRWAYPICKFGLVIRGFVLMIIGVLFLIAAWQVNPEQAGGLGDALRTLQEQPFGTVLLGFVALGLFAFGIYSIIEAIYRRVSIN